jgi:hypothetical protein
MNIDTDDNIVDLDGFTLNGNLLIDQTADRTEVRDGVINGEFHIGGTHKVLYNLDINTTSGNNTLDDGSIMAIVHTDIFNDAGYPIYCSEYHTTDLIIVNTALVAGGAGPNAGFRCMGNDKIVMVDSRVVGVANAPLRLHAGDSSEGATGGMNNVWINKTQVEGSGLGAFWVNLQSGSPIDPAAVFDRILIDDNDLYETNFEVNSELDPGSDYTNFTVTNNITNFDDAYNGGDVIHNWTLTLPWAGADPTWYFPIGVESDANQVLASTTIPTYTGGYGTGGGEPPAEAPKKISTGSGPMRPSLRF